MNRTRGGRRLYRGIFTGGPYKHRLRRLIFAGGPYKRRLRRFIFLGERRLPLAKIDFRRRRLYGPPAKINLRRRTAPSTPGTIFAGGVLAPNYVPACENLSPTTPKMRFLVVSSSSRPVGPSSLACTSRTVELERREDNEGRSAWSPGSRLSTGDGRVAATGAQGCKAGCGEVVREGKGVDELWL